jgi:CxxC motif-containing protein (DUF1111 family)
VGIEYSEVAGRYADGERYTLRAPRYQLRAAGFGPLPDALLISARVAPATIGMGLLEAVPEASLARLADADDRDGDGISGRLNRVLDVERGALASGRFGWKAEQPSVRAQVAAAFVGDMGITSSLFPHENHTRAQAACDAAPSGGSPELSAATLDSVVLYMRSLAVPARRAPEAPAVRRGEQLFSAAGCAGCHVSSLRTGEVADLPELSRQTLRAFTDLLLHDLGPGLSDQRPTFAASGSEWRTAPLWGIGLFAKVNGHTFLLHDGRARGVAEAILWHAGEAEAAKQRFVRLARTERQDLVRFVESL